MIVDLGYLHCDVANAAVDRLCKSVEDSIVDDPHPLDALLGAMEDDTTLPIRRRLLELQDAMIAIFVTGRSMAKAKKVAWLPEERSCARLEQELVIRDPGSLGFQEYIAIIDCLLKRYLPEKVIQSEASTASVRQYLVGHLRARETPIAHAVRTVAALPATLDAATQIWGNLTRLDRALIAVAQTNAARLVTDLRTSVRSRMEKIIINAEKTRLQTGTTAYKAAPLVQQLQEEFGELNRDWRRIAVTETAMNSSDAFLLTMPVGSMVKWVSHSDACEYCLGQNGKTFRVVRSQHDAQSEREDVWPGKTVLNVGRAIAKRKRLPDGTLIDRDETELVVPMIPAHPHCRCVWVPQIKKAQRRAS